MNPQGALHLLINVAFDLFIFLVLTRFLLQLVRADFYNPLSQFVVKATNPLLVPMRKLIPNQGAVDVAALVAVVALIVVKLVLLIMLTYGALRVSPALLLVSAVKMLASTLLNYLFWAIILRIVLSWVSPDPRNPVTLVVAQLTEPVMAPVRKILPPMGGLDLSPILILLAIQLLQVLFGL